jgi:hypothetical protein
MINGELVITNVEGINFKCFKLINILRGATPSDKIS